MKYRPAKESFRFFNNPEARKGAPVTLELPYGEFEDLRVRVALVRSPEYKKLPPVYLDGTKDIFHLMRHASFEPQEVLTAIYLSPRLEVIGIHEVARGGLDSTRIDPRALFEGAFLCGAHGIVLAHNHPGTSARPSGEDLLVTRNMVAMCNLLGFSFQDHVVVGQNDFASVMELFVGASKAGRLEEMLAEAVSDAKERG